MIDDEELELELNRLFNEVFNVFFMLHDDIEDREEAEKEITDWLRYKVDEVFA